MNTWKKYVLTEDESKKLVESDDQSFIGFSNLTSISVEVAHILAQFRGCLCFKHLVDDLVEDVAAALVKHKAIGGVFLEGLTRLLPGTAAALANYKGGMISLNGLTSLSDEAAVELGKYLGGEQVSLHLSGLTSLSDNAAIGLAKYLGRFETSLYLDGLTSLTARAAKELAKCQGVLQLQGLIRPSEEVLDILKLSPAMVVMYRHEDLSEIYVSFSDYVESVRAGLGIAVSVFNCLKGPEIGGYTALASIEQMPDDVITTYFTYIFSDHSTQSNDSWLAI